MGHPLPSTSPGTYEFGRRFQTFFYSYGVMELQAGGKIRGYVSDNETRWDIEGRWIVLLDCRGETSVRCDSPTPLLGFQGWFRQRRDCVHYLHPYQPLQRDRLSYVISTHTYNAPHTVPALLDRLSELGIDLARQVAIVVGQSPLQSAASVDRSLFRSAPYLFVPYNSFEYGALMALPELARNLGRCDPDHYWFLLHDTMTLGSDFPELSIAANSFGHPDIIYAGMHVTERFRCGWHNLGAYRFGFIQRIQPMLVDLLDRCSRREGILAEVGGKRAVWRMAHVVASYPGVPKWIDRGESPYHGRVRLERHFPTVDVTKFHTLVNETHSTLTFPDSTGDSEGPGAEPH